jgi:heterodisulfide reductase subunit B
MDALRGRTVSYFPGCSLATSARENNHSLVSFLGQAGIRTEDLPDWNCCGSSSAHSVAADIGFQLAARNLSLAPAGRPLLVACPSCYQRLAMAKRLLLHSEEKRNAFRKRWGRSFDADLEIVSFFEILSHVADEGALDGFGGRLEGLRFVPYYGCMLFRPPAMRGEKNFHAMMEKILSRLGAEPLPWSHSARCCGTFLSVSRPDIARKSVRQIMEGAGRAGTECIVTACAMCHLNLEIRSELPGRIPVLHFSELLSLAAGKGSGRGWFRRHLIDPRPVLRSRHLIQ